MMDELLEEMIDPAPSREDAARRRRAWATGSILALAAVGVASLTTSALFTDQDDLAGTISTGTLVLGAEGAQFDMPLGGLAPGGSVVAPLRVVNEGSLELRYALSVSAQRATPEGRPGGAGNLTEQLRVTVLAPGVTCTTEATAAPAAADVLGASPSTTGFGLPATDTPIVGDPATGADTTPGAGDRTLPGGSDADETLCVRVDMASTAGNEFQDTAAVLRFVLDSEQTVNNP
ncbi:hypothetical protein GC089_03850 [Cellulomonas sp. JZ18]|uniref:hypothetical protein n=1 Tax=Cellulomonas sp. JZ18 TaxID=2654191 RepID=UPI0012D3A65F|nr:hypothetical protein [Cellulomonas sp. JZ18]QGQ18548.1 hypothetical protein GC089_03850 [Cellulomonas sp. JZ18]